MVCENIGLPLERLKFDETAFVGARTKVLDVTRLNLRLPNRRQTDIKKTLGAVIAWAKEKIAKSETMKGEGAGRAALHHLRIVGGPNLPHGNQAPENSADEREEQSRKIDAGIGVD